MGPFATARQAPVKDSLQVTLGGAGRYDETLSIAQES